MSKSYTKEDWAPVDPLFDIMSVRAIFALPDVPIGLSCLRERKITLNKPPFIQGSAKKPKLLPTAVTADMLMRWTRSDDLDKFIREID